MRINMHGSELLNPVRRLSLLKFTKEIWAILSNYGRKD
jgi:hypothetical protein